jgi:CheY-like chemotaxis protein
VNGVESRRKTVLVCDDDAQIAHVLKITLERLGYDSDVRTDASESLTVFAEDPYHYDLAILDGSMPGMTGEELAGRIAAIRPEMPVVLLTGREYAEPGRPPPKGVTEVQWKPLKRAELSALLDRLIPRA